MEPARKIERALLALDETPLVGSPPPFPFEAVSEGLKKLFSLDSVELKGELPQWVQAEELAPATAHLTLVATPLDSPFHLLLPEGEIDQLLKLLLQTDEAAAALQDQALRGALLHFVAAEALATLGAAGYPGDLKIHLANREAELPSEALAVDFSARLGSVTLRGRLLLPSPFLHQWRQHFVSKEPSELALSVEVRVGLEGGQVKISPKQWATLNEGDLLLLDRCTVDPTSGRGAVTLTLEGEEIFNGQLTDSGLQL